MSKDYRPARAREGAGVAVTVRCKGCAARFEVTHPSATATCPGCGERWKVRWFTPDLAMIVAPLDWIAYQAQARRAPAREAGHA